MTFPGLILISVAAFIVALAFDELRPIVEFAATFAFAVFLVGMGYASRRGAWYLAAGAVYGLGLARLL